MNKVEMMSAKDKKKGSQVPRLRFPEFLNAEEWEAKRLGELFSERQETNFPSLPLLSLTERNGIIPQEQGSRANTASGDKSKYLRVIPGDIAYNTMRMWEGRSALVGLEGIVSPAYTVCIPQKGNSSSFFSYYFKTQILIEKFHRYSQGLVNDTLNLKFKAFEKITVFSPRSFREQKKIADCLSSLDERITAETSKLDTLKAHKTGLLKQLFPVEGEALPQLRFPEFRGAGEWQKFFLGEYSEVVRGGSPRPIDNFLTAERGGLNWLKIGDINKEAKYVVATTEKVRAEALNKTREISPGDLILSNSMSFGRPYISKIKTCIHDGWIAITEISKKLHVDYIYYLISSPFSQHYFTINAAGSGVQNLNADIIKSLPIFFPNILEQQRIADCLSSLDELITAQAQKIDLLKTHKKGLMQQLFPVIDEAKA